MALFLAGCKPSADSDAKRPLVWRAPALEQQSAGIQALREWSEQPDAPLYAASAAQQTLTGKAQRELLQVWSSANFMRVEGEVFAQLVRMGYRRKVVRDQAGSFVVEYLHQQDMPLSAEYRDQVEQEGVKSTVLFSWPKGY